LLVNNGSKKFVVQSSGQVLCSIDTKIPVGCPPQNSDPRLPVNVELQSAAVVLLTSSGPACSYAGGECAAADAGFGAEAGVGGKVAAAVDRQHISLGEYRCG